MKNCPTCGNTCDDQCLFCAGCGYKFEGNGNAASSSDCSNDILGQNNQPPYQSQPQQNNMPPYQSQPQQNNPPLYCSYEKPRNNPLAIASLVLGIFGVVFACCYGAGVIPAILAIIFGAVSRGDISRPGNNEGGLGMSRAGLILGIISVAIAIITFIIIAIYGISALSLTNSLNSGGDFTSSFST